MRHVGILLAAAMVLTACGQGPTTEEGVTATTAAAQASDATVAEETTTTTEAPRELSLADFLPGWGTSPDEFDAEAEQERFQAQQAEMQELIADCMADEGFEYIPFVIDESAFFFGPDMEDDFVETYGFGISTFILNDPFMSGEEDFDPFADDPNQEIVEGLTEAEREEYFFVLYGDEPDFDFENATEDEIDEFFSSWQPTGCQAQADQQVFVQQAFFEEFGDAFEEMFTRAEADPRIIAIEDEWSLCMTDAGYTFSASQDMYEYLQNKVDEIVTWPEPDFSSDIEAPDFENMTEEEIDAFIAEQDAMYQPQFDEDELKALNEEEIAIALANEACFVDSEEVWQEVMAELEEQFLDENREALEAFLDG